MTVLYTGFPGLVVRYGRWCTDVVPDCGCDACDDDPAELVELFTVRTWSVAREGFHESRAIRRGGVEESYRFAGGGSTSGWTVIDDHEERRRLRAAESGTIDWPPWRLRPPP